MTGIVLRVAPLYAIDERSVSRRRRVLTSNLLLEKKIRSDSHPVSGHQTCLTCLFCVTCSTWSSYRNGSRSLTPIVHCCLGWLAEIGRDEDLVERDLISPSNAAEERQTGRAPIEATGKWCPVWGQLRACNGAMNSSARPAEEFSPASGAPPLRLSGKEPVFAECGSASHWYERVAPHDCWDCAGVEILSVHGRVCGGLGQP
jgi:hypothetical protein